MATSVTENNQLQWIATTGGGAAARLSATLDNIERIDDRITGWLRHAGRPLDEFGVRLLVREALLNAVLHGCARDPSRYVQFSIRLDEALVEFVVEDDGPGFDWQAPRPDLDALGATGRGVTLLRMYADSVTYNERGNRVRVRCGRLRPPAD